MLMVLPMGPALQEAATGGASSRRAAIQPRMLEKNTHCFLFCHFNFSRYPKATRRSMDVRMAVAATAVNVSLLLDSSASGFSSHTWSSSVGEWTVTHISVFCTADNAIVCFVFQRLNSRCIQGCLQAKRASWAYCSSVVCNAGL